mmetsp:Transcript_30102/g.82240  ORF Transcript_30102/g.82240 Transcript_30102/m.82240 type:complete len:298 (-) Transcript_30102:609-1502(-)
MHTLDLQSLRWDRAPSPPNFDYMSHTCIFVERLGNVSVAASPVADTLGGADSSDAGAIRQLTQVGASLIVFGGVTMREVMQGDELHAGVMHFEQPVTTDRLLLYAIGSGEWHELSVNGWTPLGRYRHAACLMRDQMIVSGGTIIQRRSDDETSFVVPISVPTDDLLVLDLDSFIWSKPECVGVPPNPFAGQTFTPVGSGVLVVGGFTIHSAGQGLEEDLADFYYLDTREWAWRRLRPEGANNFSKRSGHTAHLCWCEHGSDVGLHLLILGGRDHRLPSWNGMDDRHLGRDSAFLLVL